MNRWLGLGLLLALAVALALRYPKLELRPVHNDEAVNAIKLQALWEKGHYVYDPHEFHGPTLYYASLPFLWLSPAHNFAEVDETTLRLTPVFFGTALILLIWLLHDGLGRTGTIIAATLAALSPAMVFYSRYFIHEMLLVFFTALVLAAGWRYTQTRQLRWALLTGAGLGLMGTTKETFVLALAAMGAAAMLTSLISRWPKRIVANARLPWRDQHTFAILLVAGIVWCTLFTSFFSNPFGLLASVRTYLSWLQRAGGASPHIHPWNFYLERLTCFQSVNGPMWGEGLILILAGVGMIAALIGRGLGETRVGLARFLTFYTLALTVAYSWIAYKTPWCLLSFLFGLILLAGIGAEVLIQLCKWRWLRMTVITLLALGAVHLAWQAWRASYVDFADRSNPYIYAQTAPDILRLAKDVEGISTVAADGHETVVKVMAPEHDYGPLLWYLRRFKNVGWWDHVPEDPFAPVMIVSAKLNAALDEKSDKKYLMVGLFEMRPGVFFELYVQSDLWRKYVETLPKNRE